MMSSILIASFAMISYPSFAIISYKIKSIIILKGMISLQDEI